jgi:hypothetical protein
MVMFRRILAVATFAVLIAAPSLACDKPGLGDEDFCGTYRSGPKTSFVKNTNGQLARFETFDDIAALLDWLPTDQAMRDQNHWGLNSAPLDRIPEERHNVRVTGFLVAVRPGEDDRDFHVIVGSDPENGPFMNVEVSGLPVDHTDEAEFERARQQINALLDALQTETKGSYLKVLTPPKVVVEGSIYFDGDHRAGCHNCPGPAFAKPTTVWEIHPVFRIETIQ